jgi:hyaluronan synthase
VAIAVGPRLLLNYLLISSLMAYLQATRYFEVTGVKHRPSVEKVGIFLIAPVYGLIHLLLMVPLRFYSLFTMASTGWGTRRKVVGDPPAPGDSTPPPARVVAEPGQEAGPGWELVADGLRPA